MIFVAFVAVSFVSFVAERRLEHNRRNGPEKMNRLTDLRRWMPRIGAIMLLTAALTGCADSPTAPSAYAPFSTQDLRVGTGAVVASGNEVSVNYNVWLYKAGAPDNKGALLESNYGTDPFEFTVGAGSVITGLEEGMLGMQEGGLRRMVLPPSMAYGPIRSGKIPPDATIIFEVDVLTVTAPS